MTIFKKGDIVIAKHEILNPYNITKEGTLWKVVYQIQNELKIKACEETFLPKSLTDRYPDWPGPWIVQKEYFQLANSVLIKKKLGIK